MKCTPEQFNPGECLIFIFICLFGWCMRVCCCYSLTWFVGITDFASVYFLTSPLGPVPCSSPKSHTAALEAFKKTTGQSFSKHPNPGTVLAPQHGQTTASNQEAYSDNGLQLTCSYCPPLEFEPSLIKMPF